MQTPRGRGIRGVAHYPKNLVLGVFAMQTPRGRGFGCFESGGWPITPKTLSSGCLQCKHPEDVVLDVSSPRGEHHDNKRNYNESSKIPRTRDVTKTITFTQIPCPRDVCIAN